MIDYHFICICSNILTISVLVCLLVVHVRLSSLLDRFVILLLFSGLYYAYGILPVFLSDNIVAREGLFWQHAQPYFLIHMAGAAFLLLFILTTLFYYRNSMSVVDIRGLFKRFHVIFFVSILLVPVGLLEATSNLAIKNVIYFLGIIVLSCFFSFFILLDNAASKLNTRGAVSSIVLLLCFITLIAFYQYYTGLAISRGDGYHHSYYYLVRPASFLFNTNNLALWFATVSSIVVIAGCLRLISGSVALVCLCMSAFGLFMTASRSVLFLFIVFSMLYLFFGINRRKLRMISLFFIPFLSLVLVPLFFSSKKVTVRDGHPTLNLKLSTTSDHFIKAAPEIISYLRYRINTVSTHHPQPLPYGTADIAGRLSSGSSDNAYILVYQKDKLLWLVLFLSILIYPVVKNARLICSKNDQMGEGVLSLYLTMLVSGSVINIFTVFPGWLFLSLSYSVLLMWPVLRKYEPRQHVVDMHYV